MRYYTRQHQFYCGIDLHARLMYLCVLDSDGKIQLHRNMPATVKDLEGALSPFSGSDLVIACECVFTWYWIADFCAPSLLGHDRHIPFVLGHALYMRAIHGAKTNNDTIDSRKIAMLLRSGMLPQAYVYPAHMCRFPHYSGQLFRAILIPHWTGYFKERRGFVSRVGRKPLKNFGGCDTDVLGGDAFAFFACRCQKRATGEHVRSP